MIGSYMLQTGGIQRNHFTQYSRHEFKEFLV